MNARPIHTRVATLVLVAVLHGSLCSAECTDARNEYLAVLADLIVTGTITEKTCRDNASPFPSGIHTEFDVSIDETLKGAPSGNVIRVFAEGGYLNGEFSAVIGFDLPFYEVGEKVLLYLCHDSELNGYRVSHHYFKIVDDLVVGGRDLAGGPTGGIVTSTSRFSESVASLLDCSQPQSLSDRSDVVLLGEVTSWSPASSREWPKTCALQVEDVWLGEGVGSVVHFVVHPRDLVEFEVGEVVVVFLEAGPSGEYGLTGRLAGKFTVEEGIATNKVASVDLPGLRSLIQE